jgi:hypothetical protein
VEAEVEVQKAVGTPIPPPPAQRVALTIVTDPPGADAVLDGRPIGKTPILGLPIPPVRKAKLVLQREGSVTLKETLSLTKDLEVTYQLVPEKVTVRVVSRPAGAKVTKRGKALGVTPFDWVAPAGVTAKLKFSKRGYRSVEQAVTAEEGVEVSAVLKKSRSGGGRRGPRPFRPSSSIDPRNPPKPGPSIPTFGD